ncbi:carbohydrate kinase [Dactylosporangium siamense]|uniref:Fructokinase n=1 Tax=Dactylosporangium siamense TaxID=685454 RepID=A0A919U9J3_9ACTN|nr:carbohydrate kinase [Dactylosporangium siamense]GIG42703.1 fructokinase [Dactylosporangium siamense]
MITVVGEALVDLIEGPPGGPSAYPGGSPANVAVALARLGADVSLLTQLGADPHGRLVLDFLAANGVRLAPGTRLDATPTSTAHTRLGPDGQADYTFDIAWRALPPSASTVDPAVACLHTGSIATFLEPGAAHVAALMRSAAATISYDPNCRPSLMGDPAAAVPRVEGLVALSDVVKVSQEDLAWLYPGRGPDEIGRAWLALGARLVVVTLGADGAWGSTAGVAVSVAPMPVRVVDTVGAGDAFTAGLLHACGAAGLLGAANRDRLAGIDGSGLAAMLTFASQVAGITCARRGADPPTLADLPS